MTWQPIDDAAGLWTAEKRTSYGWSVRSTAVRLADGGVVVVSPLRDMDDAGHAALAAIGPVRALLAPNHFHHLGLPSWRARYPGAAVAASDAAAPRARKKSGVDIGPLDAVRALLPAHVSILEPPGTKTGEVFVRVAGDAGVTWVVSDAFFHVVERPTGALGAILRWTGTAPGLRIGGTFLKLGLRDRAAYRAWLDAQLDADRPRRLVVGHGEPLADDDLAARLAALSRQRLR